MQNEPLTTFIGAKSLALECSTEHKAVRNQIVSALSSLMTLQALSLSLTF